MTGTYPTRRRLLLASGSALTAALAGCASQGGGDGTTTDTKSAVDASANAQTATQTATSDTDSAAESQTNATETMTPDPASFDGESVTFTTDGDAEIQGTLYGDGDCGVVMVPQTNFDRESWREQAQLLAATGHAALPIDEGDEPPAAVLAAMAYLKEAVGVSNVVLIGGSSGGEAVVRANAQAEDGAVAGVMGISTAGGGEVAGDLQGRKLFIVGKDDDKRFVDTAKQLHENAPDPKRLVILDSDAHAQRIFDSPHANTLTDLLLSFVEESCGT
ncbi:alpha/beta hydrolase family protein [Haladaptatus sp. CMSO5]|uniref:alpha/beta hydrolase family protein n=1 Tax=Haladaptatus sp. CMSO5 TaxID=3120514 RepID=UPI002FCE689A